MSDLASSNNAPPPETKHKSWADEEVGKLATNVEENFQKTLKAESSTASVSSLDVGKLAIDENKKRPFKFLDEPSDSIVKAVRSLLFFHLDSVARYAVTSGDTPYTSASTFED